VVAAVAEDATGAGAATDPAHRGRLVVHDRVVERIATAAACEVDGVVRSGGTLDGVVGRRYPRAEARTAGSRTRVDLTVAVVWPTPLPRALGEVREHVRDRLRALAGLEADAVDVVAATLVSGTDAEPARRVR